MFDITKSVLMQTVFACKSANKLEDAKVFLNIASKYCFDLGTLDEIAYLQNEIKDYASCVESLKRCLAMARGPQEAYAVRANLAKMYNHLNDPLNSINMSNANREVNPNDYDTLMELSFSHYLNGDYKTSESMMRQLASHPDLPDNVKGRVLYNLGSYDIEHGEFKKGLKGFIDIGHKINIWHHREVEGVPQWDGTAQPGKTLIIHAEGGIGDELINVRFVNNVKNLGMNPIWVSGHKSLVDVFNRNGYPTTTDISTIDKSNAVQCMAMYLPILLDVDKDQLWNGAYLKPSQEYIDKWTKLLPEGKKLALKWSGNPFYDQDLHRSIPLDFIKEIQYNGTKINLQMEPELFQEDMFNAGEFINSIEDTLAILWLCDDLITSCTSIAHMNGALGKNGVVCPPIACYYVWLGADGVSDWYDPSLKVIRQKQHKNWDFVKTVLQ